jgi:hypothetical protein
VVLAAEQATNGLRGARHGVAGGLTGLADDARGGLAGG